MGSGPHKFSNRQLEAMLRKHAGIMSLAANELKTSRQAVQQRVKSSAHLMAALADIKETLLDLGEGHIVKAMHGGDMPTNRWYLERQGAARGYANKTQVETKLPDGELEALIAAFGGDIGKLRAVRDALDPAKAGQP